MSRCSIPSGSATTLAGACPARSRKVPKSTGRPDEFRIEVPESMRKPALSVNRAAAHVSPLHLNWRESRASSRRLGSGVQGAKPLGAGGAPFSDLARVRPWFHPRRVGYRRFGGSIEMCVEQSSPYRRDLLPRRFAFESQRLFRGCWLIVVHAEGRARLSHRATCGYFRND